MSPLEFIAYYFLRSVNQLRLNDQLDLILSESTINRQHAFVESLRLTTSGNTIWI